MRQVLVYGSREFGQVVKDLVIQCGYTFTGFIDDYYTGSEITGTYADILGNYPTQTFEIVVAVGYKNLTERWKIYQKIVNDGYAVPSLIHPKAYVRDLRSVGSGVMVMAGAVADVYTKIDDLAVLWPGVVVNHDSHIMENSFLSPNSTVCGASTVGRNCFVGAGAVVVDHVTVPCGSFIKAGTVFTGK